MEIGICGGFERADDVRAAGASYLEVNVQAHLAPLEPEAAFVPRLETALACGLPVRAANCFLPGSLKCVGPDVDMERLADYAAVAFDRARRMGIGVIVYGSGGSRQVPDGFPPERAFEQYVECLARFGPLARANMVTLVVEPLNSRECNLINSLREGALAVRRANQPAVALLVDLYHMLVDGEPFSEVERFVHLIQHAHVAEREGRMYPGFAGDDFRTALSALHKAGYRGGISLECGFGDDYLAGSRAGVAALAAQARDVGCSL
jgi:sugar phosphate isomerase/epimerase